jgi:glucose/mannose-6-phosphate isomerase
MEDLINGFAEQLRLAIRIGVDVSIDKPDLEIRNVVIAGMGGSGIGGDIVMSLNRDYLKVPIEVVKAYSIPNYVNKNTLFIASSYSGNTEETNSCLKEAIAKNAIISVITSGGKILERADEVEASKLIIPGEVNCPRAHVGLSFISLLFTLNKFSLISDYFIKQIENGASLIEQDKDILVARAKELAMSIKSKLPIIYSDEAFYPVALRLQQQINENSKKIAHINVFPEMNHNELVGWADDKSNFDSLILIYLKNKFIHPLVAKRMEICKDVFREKIDGLIEIDGKGDSLLEQYIYLFHLIDWTSYFIAIENETDPFPVDNIDYLKSKLA